MTQEYIFGYGSLICSDSRARTAVSGDANPALVQGIERGWVVPTIDGHTVLGATANENAKCNGVVFPVSPSSLDAFDAREREYHRIQIPHDQISTTLKLQSSDRVWTYVGDDHKPPCRQFPIAQSYLDVILNGCSYFGEDFVEQFVMTTQHWLHGFNDRGSPRYPRFIAETQLHHPFDQLLAQYLPDFLANRT